MKARNVHLNLSKMAAKLMKETPERLRTLWPDPQFIDIEVPCHSDIEAALRVERLHLTDAEFRKRFAFWL